MKSFNQKYGPWVVITGGTSGIGKEFAELLAEKKMNLILIARNKTSLEDYSKHLTAKYSIQIKTIAADISKTEGIEAIKTSTVGLEIGLLILSAGLEVNGAIEKNNILEELNVVQVNVISTLLLTHHFIPEMIKNKKGGILFVASLSGHMPNPYLANYAGTKAYVLNYAASLYSELKPKGIDVTVLSPGLTNTPMVKDNGVDWSKTPMKAMSPRDVATKGLESLGVKLIAIPGFMNNVMAFFAKHLPIRLQTIMNENMMRKAISKNKI